jgi:hypothetical protein
VVIVQGSEVLLELKGRVELSLLASLSMEHHRGQP